MGEDDGTVYLKNVYLSQYLYATKDKFPNDPRYRKIALAPKKQTGEFKWKFIPYTQRFSHVQNVAYEEYFEHSCGYNEPLIYTMCLSKDKMSYQVTKC
jgi:hypothetical protein